MKKFDYPQFQVSVLAQLPAEVDACIEWREQSQQSFVNAQLKGERRLRTILPDGCQWSFAKAPGLHNSFEILTLARAAVAGALRSEDTHLALIADREELMDALLSAVLAAQYEMPSFSRHARPSRDLQISIVGDISPQRVSERLAEAEGNAFVRYLTALPANELNPWSYRELIEELAEIEGWDCRVYRYKELQQMGAGAFLSVAKGSDDKEASIVRIQYKGNPDCADSVALVGKGVTIDTGGYNLKTGGSMFGMNGDMNGSAVVIGNILTASLQNQKINLVGWIALTENHIGPNAYHANEWVKALNGTTIEVVDTDAEGRMILADTLTLASREHPLAVFDYATLTGACVGALSTRYSGAFTNHDAWIMPIIESGKVSGERVWPFPLDVDYDEHIKSKVADVQQCNSGKSSDHIDAARFLSRFVEPQVRWLHLDLSSANHKGGLAHIPTDITGFGIRLTQTLLKALL